MGTSYLRNAQFEKILQEVLKHEPKVDTVERLTENSFQKLGSLKSLDLSKYESVLAEVKTDELAYYEPSRSIGRIVYNARKIAYYSDLSLEHVCRSISIGQPINEMIACFRIAFSTFIRRHETFHYLVERGSTIFVEVEAYKEYLKKVYHERNQKNQGNLEEALAEAYAASLCEQDLSTIFESRSQLLKATNFNPESLSLILKKIFVEGPRPPGYNEARHFLTELSILNDIAVEAIVFVITLGEEDWWKVFKGLTWLFYELTVCKPHDFTNPHDPSERPFSQRYFAYFLANFQHPQSILELLLPWPDEHTA